MIYDFLIVGAGLFGSVCARQLVDAGYKCLVVDKRNHIGGNCYTENVNGINVHKYGAHVFHTKNIGIWNFVNGFCEFNNYIHEVKVNCKNKLYPFPINFFTLHQLFGISNPSEIIKKLNEKRIEIKNPQNMEEFMLSQVGREIYEMFIYEYTKKQWNKDPKLLPVDIIKRVPIRFSFNDTYFEGQYQGIPIGGYSKLIANLLNGCDIKLSSFFKDNMDICKNIIFSGRIDEFFDYKFGKLEFRSLRFEEQILDIEDFQGNSVINYADRDVPFTRIIEHKHFEFGKQKNTVITREYPSNEGDAIYPINDEKNNNLYNLYLEESKKLKNVFFGGRLGAYKYIDMDQAIEQALSLAERLKTKLIFQEQ